MRTENLIRKVKLVMIETGWDRHGKRTELAKILNVNLTQLSYALTGYRDAPKSTEILERIYRFLRKKL